MDKPEEKEIIKEEETSVEDKEEPVEDVKGETTKSQSDSEDKTDNQEKTSNDESQSSSEDDELINDSNQSSEPVNEQSENADSKEEEKPSEPEEKEAPVEKVIPKSKEGKEGSFMPIFFIMIISLVIAFSWDKFDFIKNSVHAVLDPTAGVLLGTSAILNSTVDSLPEWRLTLGMLLVVLIINFLTTFIQKYATDQGALRELKKEQKILQEEMKKYKDRPEKVAELSKKQLQFIPKTFKLTSRAVMFTGIPFILFFRWFTDVFTVIEAATGAPIRFLGFLSWFWFYLIFTMVFSSILRKVFKVV